MKYYFLTSIIPFVVLCLHSLKHYNNAFLPIFVLVYLVHLGGRPYKLGVTRWYRLQRIAELVLIQGFESMYLCLGTCLCLIPLEHQVFLPSVYALSLAFSNRNPVLCLCLMVLIILHDLPFNKAQPFLYFHVRMAKNAVLFLLLWWDTQLYWYSLLGVLFIVVSYRLTDQPPKMHMEYFEDPVPSTYPIPLDVKDAVDHCETAKVLFKIHIL
jgi:hypothetical protein